MITITTIININPFRHHHQPLHLLALVQFILLRPFSLVLAFRFVHCTGSVWTESAGKATLESDSGARNKFFLIQISHQLDRKMAAETTFGHWKVFFFGHCSEEKCFFSQKNSHGLIFKLIHPEPKKYFWIVFISTFLLFFLSNMCLFFNFSPLIAHLLKWRRIRVITVTEICYTCSSAHLDPLLRWRKAAVQSFAVSPLETQSRRFTGPERW